MQTPVACVEIHVHGWDQLSFEFPVVPASGDPGIIDNATESVGAAFILVVSAIPSPMPMTQQHVRQATRAEALGIVAFINKCDVFDNKSSLDLVEKDLPELDSAIGLDRTGAFIARESALNALRDRSSRGPWDRRAPDLAASLDGTDD